VGTTDGAEAAELRKRAERLRQCAKDARSIARRLGPYLDDAVKRAVPRSGAGKDGANKDAIWQGPYADQCTTLLKQRRSTLGSMAGALLADATRWDGQADDLERQAKEKDKAKAGTGGN
jgi:hypothetical protein